MIIEKNPKELAAMEQFHKGNRQEGLRLQEEFAAEFREEYREKDHCPCKKACRYHGNCKECVAIHRAHQEHVPNCMRPVINAKLKSLSELTEHTLAYEIEPPHEILRREFQESGEQIGREPAKDNDLFYTCSLIDYIARKTKNRRADVVRALGEKRLEKIYDLADVYHSDNIDRVSDDFIEEAGIPQGDFDNVGDCGYAIPTHWDIGKVYKRLIKMVAQEKQIGIIEALQLVYTSFISDKIDDYNSSVYYENPSYLFESFMEGKVL